jgi:tetratricopeptide (TPR) repeat protein
VPIAGRLLLYDSRTGEPLLFASSAPPPIEQDSSIDQNLRAFEAAMREKRLLAGDRGDAMTLLQTLKTMLAPAAFEARRNDLRVALEENAQEILLRYLAGDQVPQTQSDFALGARYMEAARQLTPESLFLEGRQDFFQGRAMLFDKKYREAGELLEQSVRIDPEVGYPFNALGIAYLEQAKFDKAIPAFRDAARKAPHWAYPLHNLALSYAETGDYTSAIRSYTQAMRLAPKVSYLPYNLGLVYQRTGRRKEAEKWYRQAMALTPGSPEPYNALGTIKASAGKRKEAEEFYRKALELNPGLLAARNNLALLLASKGDRFNEAVQLWQQNLTGSPEHLPSRLSLAEALAGNGRTKEAIGQYQEVVRLKPEYVGARVAMAALLAKDGRTGDALVQLREASRRQPADARILEQIGDAELASGNAAGARAAYEQALKQASDAGARKAVRKKLERAGR